MATWSALISRSTPVPLHNRPSLTLFFLLAGTFLLTLVPFVVQFPLWLTISVIAAMVLRSVIEFYRLPLPSTGFCGFIAILLLGLTWLQFSTVLGRDAGTALTAGLLAIKFYELRSPRDLALIIFSCLFLVMSALLYSQAIELFIYCLIMMWILTALLLRTQMGDLPIDRLLSMLRVSGLIFLQAVPLTLFLFFFFPRYTGKLQVVLPGSPLGFTNTVRPGDIAELSRNDTKAMYVLFLSDGVPNVETMYWRGLVLWSYKDGIWTMGKLSDLPDPQLPKALHGSQSLLQEITIYPHNQRWLFALDTPITPAVDASEQQPWSATYNGHILELSGLSDKLDHMERYTVTSAISLADEVLKPEEKAEGISLPDNEISSQVHALADKLHQANPDPQDYIRAVLHYFRHEHFTYTAIPGVDHKDWLTDFLFVTKAGFCEHFASAFAVLMRIEHVPARLVVGYQGADYNPYNNTYIVRQSNAHAWDEVWIDAKNAPPGSNEGHWVRVDPTAILPPSMETPSSANNSGQQNPAEDLSIQVANHRLTFSEAYLPTWVRHAVTQAQLRREQVETAWDDWVFSYDPDAQIRLAQALGFGRQARVVLLILSLVTVGICIFLFRRWTKRKPPIPPVENLYAQFCRNMAQRGIPRAEWEGPLAYTGRVAEVFPEKKEAIRDVGWIIARARYGAEPLDSTAPRELKSLLQLITASQAASSSRERN